MRFEVEKNITKVKLELTEEEFNTLYTAFNITGSTSINVNAKDANIKVLNSLGQRDLFNQLKSVYGEL